MGMDHHRVPEEVPGFAAGGKAGNVGVRWVRAEGPPHTVVHRQAITQREMHLHHHLAGSAAGGEVDVVKLPELEVAAGAAVATGIEVFHHRGQVLFGDQDVEVEGGNPGGVSRALERHDRYATLPGEAGEVAERRLAYQHDLSIAQRLILDGGGYGRAKPCSEGESAAFPAQHGAKLRRRQVRRRPGGALRQDAKCPGAGGKHSGESGAAGHERQ
jgi:hypothetical protein